VRTVHPSALGSFLFVGLACATACAPTETSPDELISKVWIDGNAPVVGGTSQLKLGVEYLSGRTLYAAYPVWTSSNSSVLEVSSTGLATGRSAGRVTVHAKDASAGRNTDASAEFEVVAGQAVTAGLTGLSIDGQPPIVGSSSQLVATAAFGDGSTRDVTTQASWSSGDSSILTISPSGLAAGVRGGTTTAQATYQGKTAIRSLNIVQQIGGGSLPPAELVACGKTADDASDLNRTLWISSLPGTSISEVDLGLTSKDTPGGYSARLTVVVGGGATGTSIVPFAVSGARQRADLAFVFSPIVTVPRDGAVRLIVDKIAGPGELSWEGQTSSSCPVIVAADSVSTAQIVGPKIPVRVIGGM